MPKNLEIKTKFTADNKMSRPVTRMSKNLAIMKKMAGSAGKAFKRLGRTIMKVGRLAKTGLKMGITAVSAVAVGGFLAINKMAGSLDNLAKTARSIDFPIEEFQEWRFVAEQSGVKTETFDKSMQKFTKTVGEAKGGYGALYTALNKNNKPLLEQLKNTENVADALDIYMKAINESGGATEKAALSAAGFGRSGIDMINMANLTTKEITALRKEMQENGVVTAAQAAEAEKYNDMMNRLKMTVMGFMRGVLVPLIPKMTAVADSIRKWILANKEMLNQKINKYFTIVKDSAIDLYNWIIENKDAFISLWEGMKKIVSFGIEVIKFFVNSKEAVYALITAFLTFKAYQFFSMMQGLAVSVAGVGTAASGTATGGIAKMMGSLKSMGLLVGALILSYEALKFAADMAFKAEDARNMANSSVTKNQLKLSGMDFKTMSDATLNSLYAAQREETARLASDIGGNQYWIGGENARMEDQASLDGLKGNTEKFHREIARRKGGGERQSYSSSTTNTNKEITEVTIKDDTGRAQITKGGKSKALKLQSTGAF